jgi:Co/Zn/Cd efflux system component
MDCPSEEKLIRMALDSLNGIAFLQFDLTGRSLTAFHETDPSAILKKLEPLNFGAKHEKTEKLSEMEEGLLLGEKAKAQGQEKSEASVLKILLVINAVMFVAEIILGYVAQSTGLIADAMDMFADAAVYGISLYAVGRIKSLQLKAARISGYAQMALAVFALSEVIRRFIFGSDPESGYMISVSLVALVANVICLMLISRHRESGVHMKAGLIFSANDVIANAGVIVAGILVHFMKSPYPDLVIGLIIATVVFRGTFSILKISRR